MMAGSTTRGRLAGRTLARGRSQMSAASWEFHKLVAGKPKASIAIASKEDPSFKVSLIDWQLLTLEESPEPLWGRTHSPRATLRLSGNVASIAQAGLSQCKPSIESFCARERI